MIKCPICTAENEDTERFCRDCGQKLPLAGRAASPPAPSPVSPSESVRDRETPVTVSPPPASFEPIETPMSIESAEPSLRDSAEVVESPRRGPLPCPFCGVVNESNFRFCKACGQTLTLPVENESAPPPPPAFAGQDEGEQPAERPAPAGTDQGPDSNPLPEQTPSAENSTPAVSAVGAPFEAPASVEPGLPPASADAGEQIPSPLQEAAPQPQQAPPAVPARPAEPTRPAEPARRPEPATVTVAPPPPGLSGGRGSAAREATGVKIVCPQCGRAGAPGEHFCSECGARLAPAPAPPAAAPLACSGCGAPFQEGDKFCKNCGARLPAAGEAPGPRLILISNGEETVYRLTQPEFTIGRHPSNDIPISSDGYISSHHARIVVEGGAAYVEDNGSTNGTFIRVRERIPLSDGDEVKVGQSILRYQP